MAEIPVHKKSSLAWLWWLLGLLLLALLLWWLLADNDDDDVTPVVAEDTTPLVVDNSMAVDNTMVAEPLGAEPMTQPATATGPITDVGELTAAGLTGLVGRQVNLRNASVTSVPNDQGFFIGSGPANRVFVAFNEVPSPGQPMKEGQVDINNGSTVSIEGQVVDKARPGAATMVSTLPAGVDAHIHASRVAAVNN